MLRAINLPVLATTGMTISLSGTSLADEVPAGVLFETGIEYSNPGDQHLKPQPAGGAKAGGGRWILSP